MLDACLAEERKSRKPIVPSILLIVEALTRFRLDRGESANTTAGGIWVCYFRCYSIKQEKTFFNVSW